MNPLKKTQAKFVSNRLTRRLGQLLVVGAG